MKRNKAPFRAPTTARTCTTVAVPIHIQFTVIALVLILRTSSRFTTVYRGRHAHVTNPTTAVPKSQELTTRRTQRWHPNSVSKCHRISSQSQPHLRYPSRNGGRFLSKDAPGGTKGCSPHPQRAPVAIGLAPEEPYPLPPEEDVSVGSMRGATEGVDEVHYEAEGKAER